MNETTRNALSSLPLDWTRVRRQDDCPDILCTGCLPKVEIANEDDLEFTAVSGTAMLCLPDAENEWFQGYFISSANESFKLLCIQQDNADPCLQCDDYQLWTVTLYHPTTRTNEGNSLSSELKKTQDFRNVISRGGDSVCWHHQNIRFRADHVFTGTKSFRLVERYFGGLYRKLRDDSTETVENVMPNVAIVTGEMTIWLKADDG